MKKRNNFRSTELKRLKNLCLLPILLLFISCYTYNNIANPGFESGKTYQITELNHKKMKIKILQVKDDFLLVTDGSKATLIPKSEIAEVEERKFSWEKTVGYTIVISAAVYGVAAWSLSKMKIGIGEINFSR